MNLKNQKGIVYDHTWQQFSGEIVIEITRAAKIAYHATKMLASTLIVAGLAGMLITLQPVVSSELGYRWSRVTGTQQELQKVEETILVQVQALQDQEKEKVHKMANELSMPNTNFSIYIPKIGAKAPIVENVNPSDSKEYMVALKEGVAHAAGSVFPGMSGGTYLFAHSSDVPWMSSQYNTIFYLLRQLEEGSVETKVPLGGGAGTKTENKKLGDEIYVFFLDKVYKYRVTEKHTVDANDVSWLLSAKEGKERLILQTCWPPGTAFKRLIIVAEPVE